MTSTIENIAGGDEIIVTVYPAVKIGMEAEFEAAFAKSVNHTRAEEGVISFEIYKIKDKAGQYLLVERYKNQAALESHLSQKHIQELFEVLHRTMVKPAEELIEFATDLFPSQVLADSSQPGEEGHWPLDTHHRQ